MSSSDDPAIRDIQGGVLIRVHVAPRSSANRMMGVHDGALKIALTAPPVEGAANKALVVFLAKTLGVPKGAVALQSGETSRNKTVRVQGITAEEALAMLVDGRLTTDH